MLRDATNLPRRARGESLSLSPLTRLAHLSLTAPFSSAPQDCKQGTLTSDEDEDGSDHGNCSSADDSSDGGANSSADDSSDSDGNEQAQSGSSSGGSDDEVEEKKPKRESLAAAAKRRREAGLRRSYAKMKEKEEKEGWRTEASRIHPHPFRPPSPSTLPNNADLGQCQSALDFFLYILPLPFIDSLVTETNRYAEERLHIRAERRAVSEATRSRQAETQHRQKAHRAWTATTRPELLAFFGCVIYMSVVNIGHTKAYWEGRTTQPFVTNAFPRERFEQMVRNFHICDDHGSQVLGGISLTQPTPQTEDRLAKIRPLVNVLRQRSMRAHYPSQHVSVDEAMVGYKGRSVMRQHIASKTQNTGFKVWVLAECTTGYLYTFDIYTGKGKRSEAGQAMRVVKQLVSDLYVHCHHVVCTDGFFSSVELWQHLHSQGFYAVATTRVNRNLFPKTLLYDNRNLQRGEFVFRQQGDLTCVSWMDEKPVNLLSTYCNVDELRSVLRRVKKQPQRLQVSCPEVVVEYHRWMRAVDVYAQKDSYYRVGRRARKWWPRLAWFLIGIAISNAHFLYRKHTGKPVGQRQFREQLMDGLVGGFTARKKRGRPPAHPKPMADGEPHLPHAGKERPCVVCADKMRKSQGQHKPRTNRGCLTCEVGVHDKCWLEHLQQVAAARAAVGTPPPPPPPTVAPAVTSLFGSLLRAANLR